MGTAENDLEQRGLVSAFVQALADLGWHDGRNIRIEYRWASGDTDRLRAEAASLAAVAPDVIFCQGTPAATALHQAAPATPIVFVMVTDPIGTSLVTSLARPGGNITGLARPLLKVRFSSDSDRAADIQGGPGGARKRHRAPFRAHWQPV
jgi:putative ABC transport system substrate-binding protein